MRSIMRYLLMPLMLQGMVVHAQFKCKIEHYSTEDGLSHDAVTVITKDREGFMWFGTWSGIDRFDGHNFVSYKSSPGDLSQLKNDRIDQIVEDRYDHLWLKAYDHQIYRFDKRTERFLPLSSLLKAPGTAKILFERIVKGIDGEIWLITRNAGVILIKDPNDPAKSMVRFSSNSSPQFRMPSNTVNFIFQDGQKQFWLATTKGIIRLTRSKAGEYVVNKGSFETIAENVTSYQESPDRVYFGTTGGNLYSYNKRSGITTHTAALTSTINSLLYSKKTGKLFASTSAGELIEQDAQGKTTSVPLSPGKPLYTIYEDRSGYLWVEPAEQGVIRYDQFHSTSKNFAQKSDGKANNGGNHYKVFEDRNGVVWALLKGGGFGFYNAQNETFDYFYDQPGSPDRQFSNIVYATYYDPAGVLWVSTDERSINKIIFNQNDFNQQLLTSKGEFKSDNEVRGICEDRKGKLWLGAKSGELYVYDHGKQLNDPFVNAPREGLGQIYCIAKDHAGNIWLGTKSNGLFKAQPIDANDTKYKLTHFTSVKGNNATLSSNEIYALVEDKQNRLWVGTFDEGLNLLITDAHNNTTISHSGELFQNYPAETFRKIRHMALDRSGNIWMGTTDGLLVFDPAALRYRSYSKIPGDKHSLGNNDVQFIYRDATDRMWLATSGGGFDQAIGADPLRSLTFKDLTTRDGLPNDYVLSCAGDKKGNIWIATLNGLSKFDPSTSRFTNYDSYDGLPKIAFSEASGISTTSGKLVFGTIRGYLSFDPEKIVNTTNSVKMAFTNLQINNEDMAVDGDNGTLSENINFTPGLTLNYNQNIISIDYTTLDYRSGLKQFYAYRLRGFDSVWHDNKLQRRATYTNLPPGRYTFEVKGSTSDLNGKAPYKQLHIQILPPPWKTWWAYIIYMIAFVIIAEVVRRITLTMLRLRQRIAVETRVAGLKQTFFTNVSHELRTPLTLILNPIEQIKNKEHLSPEGEEYISIVKKNANRMVRFINQLLDLRKVQSGKAELRISHVEMVSFVQRIADYFKGSAIEKRIDIQLNSGSDELWAWIDAEKIDIVVYNLLGNAVKFTPEGSRIVVSISKLPGDKKFTIAVADEGSGVAPDKLTDIFELYFEGENNHMKGTGIGLALSKELTELHGGRIFAENTSPKGLTVTVELLLGKDHLDREGVVEISTPDTFTDQAEPVTNILTEHKIVHEHGNQQLLLLVEDNAELRRFLTVQLSEFYRVQTAENGSEGYQKALDLKPDLVISDIMMPVMNGIEMLDKLKNDIATSHIPVILLSAKFSIESQIEGLRYGADYYITKPFQNEMLLAAIASLIKQRKKLYEALSSGKPQTVPATKGSIITAKDEAFLKQVIRIVDEKMSDAKFNIDTVAETIGMGRTTFYVKLKSLTNMAPVEFVREARLRKGKQLLDEGENNISTIAYTVGFNNAKYFGTCFKEFYHISPSEYLRERTAKK